MHGRRYVQNAHARADTPGHDEIADVCGSLYDDELVKEIPRVRLTMKRVAQCMLVVRQ